MPILIPENHIQIRIDEIADELNHQLSLSTRKKVFICLLNGGFMFYSDLVKQIKHPIECSFLRVKSYSSPSNQGDIQILKDISTPIQDKDIYLVDDIFDSGNTFNYLLVYFKEHNPHSQNVVTLLTRNSPPPPLAKTHIYGFQLKDEWVYGYGMDHPEGGYRNNPNIFAL
jgi:hypoxanthine phosphoribosyltransferase